MFNYTYDQLSKIVSIPIITILLVWTIVIFHKNRKRWAPYDIPIVAVLVQSILRNVSVLIYTVLKSTESNVDGKLPATVVDFDYCSVGVWLFNSLHTFQATTLTTLALIGTFTIRLRRQRRDIKQYLTATHLVYHMFCLTTLCACVGVAAILAQDQQDDRHRRGVDGVAACDLMPYELDVKFYVFVMTLHAFLACVSFVAFACICYHHYGMRRASFDYVKKSSTSDLSDSSLGLSTIANPNENVVKGYYDTYTIPCALTGNANAAAANVGGNGVYEGGHYNVREGWNSDLSNISTTVSSTNSRKPCLRANRLSKRHADDEEEENGDEERHRSGLETIHPVLIVSYLFHHLPLIILCASPRLITPWSVTSVGLWLGLLQDLLIPISLGIVDSRFGKWISKVYKCTDRRRRIDDKLPQVGLDGKFRPFGSQPQSLEVTQLPNNNNVNMQERRLFQTNNDHKFPITNGSLYTSIDGRLPIIHNYRRPKDLTRGHRQDGHMMNLGLHSSHLKRVDYIQQHHESNYQKSPINNYVCINCTNTTNNVINKNAGGVNSGAVLVPVTKKFNLNQLDQSIRIRMENATNPLQMHDDESIDSAQKNVTNIEIKEEPMMMMIKRSALLTLDNINRDRSAGDIDDDDVADNATTSSDDEDEYYPDSMNVNEDRANDNHVTDFDTLSSKSSYSITTEANCDFDFYHHHHRQQSDETTHTDDGAASNGNVVFIQNNERKCFRAATPKATRKGKPMSKNGSASDVTDIGVNFKITRSNSKRSLENLQVYMDENFFYANNNNNGTLFKSNSFVTLDDTTNSTLRTMKLRDFNANHPRNKTVLEINRRQTNDDNDAMEEERLRQHLKHRQPFNQSLCYGGSVPDFKKVFISDYL